MPTLTASRRAVIATALGLAMSISLVACSQPLEDVGCSLYQWHGDLVNENGRAVLRNSDGSTMPLVWPDGWTVRPTSDGQLEVLGGGGEVLTRTGEAIKLEGVDAPEIDMTELAVCPFGLVRYGVAPDGEAP